MPAQFLAPASMGYAGELLNPSLATSSSTAQSISTQIQMNNKTHHRTPKGASSTRSAPGVYRYYFKGPMATVKKQASSQVRS